MRRLGLQVQVVVDRAGPSRPPSERCYGGFCRSLFAGQGFFLLARVFGHQGLRPPDPGFCGSDTQCSQPAACVLAVVTAGTHAAA